MLAVCCLLLCWNLANSILSSHPHHHHNHHTHPHHHHILTSPTHSHHLHHHIPHFTHLNHSNLFYQFHHHFLHCHHQQQPPRHNNILQDIFKTNNLSNPTLTFTTTTSRLGPLAIHHNNTTTATNTTTTKTTTTTTTVVDTVSTTSNHKSFSVSQENKRPAVHLDASHDTTEDLKFKVAQPSITRNFKTKLRKPFRKAIASKKFRQSSTNRGHKQATSLALRNAIKERAQEAGEKMRKRSIGRARSRGTRRNANRRSKRDTAERKEDHRAVAGVTNNTHTQQSTSLIRSASSPLNHSTPTTSSASSSSPPTSNYPTSMHFLHSSNSSSNTTLLRSADNWQVFPLLLVEIATVVGNSLVCLSVALERRLRTITNYILVSLAIADLLVSLVVMPGYIAQEFKGFWPYGIVTCAMWQMADVTMCTSSIMHMCIISLDRFKCIRDPLSIRDRSKWSVAARILAVWVFAICVSSPLAFLAIFRPADILNSKTLCIISNPNFLVYGSIAAFYLPLIVMLITYSLTIKLLRQKASETENSGGLRRSLSTKKLQPQNKDRVRVARSVNDAEERFSSSLKEYRSNNSDHHPPLKRLSTSQIYKNDYVDSPLNSGSFDNKPHNLCNNKFKDSVCYYQIEGSPPQNEMGSFKKNHSVLQNKNRGERKDDKNDPGASALSSHTRFIPPPPDERRASNNTAINSEPAEQHASHFTSRACVFHAPDTTFISTNNTHNKTSLGKGCLNTYNTNKGRNDFEGNSRRHQVSTLDVDDDDDGEDERVFGMQEGSVHKDAFSDKRDIRDPSVLQVCPRSDGATSKTTLDCKLTSVKDSLPMDATMKKDVLVTYTVTTTLPTTSTLPASSTVAQSPPPSERCLFQSNKSQSHLIKAMSKDLVLHNDVREGSETTHVNSANEGRHLVSINTHETKAEHEKGLDLAETKRLLASKALKQAPKQHLKLQLRRQTRVDGDEGDEDDGGCKSEATKHPNKRYPQRRGSLKQVLKQQHKSIQKILQRYEFKTSLSSVTDASSSDDAFPAKKGPSKASPICIHYSTKDSFFTSNSDSNFSPNIKVSDFSDPYSKTFHANDTPTPPVMDTVLLAHTKKRSPHESFSSCTTLKSPPVTQQERGFFRQVSLRSSSKRRLQQVNPQRSSSKSVTNERKAVKVLGLMFAMFVACWFVFFTTNFAMGVCPGCKIDEHFFKYVLWLGYTSSLINPIIYTVFNLSFRKAFIRILTCQHCFQFCKRKRKDTQMFLKYN